MTVIDLDTNTQVDTDPDTFGVQAITTGDSPVGLAVVGDRLYVTNYDAGTVTVIDTSTNPVIDMDPGVSGNQGIVVGTRPAYIAVYRRQVMFLTGNSDSVSVSTPTPIMWSTP